MPTAEAVPPPGCLLTAVSVGPGVWRWLRNLFFLHEDPSCFFHDLGRIESEDRPQRPPKQLPTKHIYRRNRQLNLHTRTQYKQNTYVFVIYPIMEQGNWEGGIFTHLDLNIQPPSPALHPFHKLHRTLPLKHGPARLIQLNAIPSFRCPA